MKTKLIGLAGPAGAGKSAVAEILWVDHGYFTMAFADRLKDVASTMFGWNRLDLEQRHFKEAVDPAWGITPRTALQLLGTEAVQYVFGKDFWVKAWLQTYEVVRHSENVVVDDVRFEHEAEAIRALGGQIVHIVGRSLPGNGVAGHSSERGITQQANDYILDNSGDTNDLLEGIEGLVEFMETVHG